MPLEQKRNILIQYVKIHRVKPVIGALLALVVLISMKTDFFTVDTHIIQSHVAFVYFTEQPQCPSVLRNMMKGVWKQKPMSLKETHDIELFLDDSRKQHGLNVTLQRNDSKCGNVSFPPKPGSLMKWFRGLCDRKGNTPCCFNNQCVNKSPDQCRCKDCYDMRQQIHAEYSDFIPEDSRCPIKHFNYLEACDLLTNATISFVGDSYIRHIYTAVLLFLRNNYVDGALSQNVKKEIYDQCNGLYMFTEKVCRNHLDQWKTSDICGGKVNLIFRYFYSSAFGPQVKNLVKNQMYNKTKSLLLFGVGLHDNFDTKNIKSKYITPVHQVIQNTKWPKLLWATPHQPGILKNGNIEVQSKAKVREFISKMNAILSPLDIPQFNTYDMTDGVMSFDGNHYGLGVNLWKFQVLLNYIQELKNNGQW